MVVGRFVPKQLEGAIICLGFPPSSPPDGIVRATVAPCSLRKDYNSGARCSTNSEEASLEDAPCVPVGRRAESDGDPRENEERQRKQRRESHEPVHTPTVPRQN